MDATYEPLSFMSEEFKQKCSEEITKEVLIKLICRNCRKYCHPPLRQCVYGHLICPTCFIEEELCVICNTQNISARPFILERIYTELEFNCKYTEHGCTFSGQGKYLIEHHKNCMHFWSGCPADPCSWKGMPANLFDHYRHSHPVHLKHDEQDYKLIADKYQVGGYLYMLNVIMTFDRVFLVMIAKCSNQKRIGCVATNMEPFNAEVYKLTIAFKSERGMSYAYFNFVNFNDELRDKGMKWREINLPFDDVSSDFTLYIQKESD